MSTIEVPLTQGLVTIIDDTDADLVLPHRWYTLRSGVARVPRAARKAVLPDGRKVTVLLHRFLMGLEHGDPLEVDHIDFDGLNNRRCNLRVVTGRQNKQYKRGRPGSSSRFVGVHWDAARRRWQAQISIDDRSISLGRFGTEIEAAEARDRYVIEHGLRHNLNLAEVRS